MNKNLKILLADPHEIFRRGTSKLLDELPYFTIVDACENANQAIIKTRSSIYDIMIVDILQSDLEKCKMIKEIKKNNPNIKIIILSMETDIKGILAMVKAGISSYLFKNISFDELVTVIQKVSLGEIYFSQEVSTLIFQHLARPTESAKLELSNFNDLSSITRREKEILQFIAEEYTNKEIAQKLYISRRTVDTHRRNLLLKLDVKNTAGLVRIYFNMKQNNNQLGMRI